jgi:hypothetical protein
MRALGLTWEVIAVRALFYHLEKARRLIANRRDSTDVLARELSIVKQVLEAGDTLPAEHQDEVLRAGTKALTDILKRLPASRTAHITTIDVEPQESGSTSHSPPSHRQLSNFVSDEVRVVDVAPDRTSATRLLDEDVLL